MAKIYGHNDAVDFAAKNLITFNGSFARGAGQPLDKSSVWYPKDGVSGYDRALAYAATDAAYVGQELAVIDVTYAEDGTTVTGTSVKFYGIQDANGTLKELGAKPTGDKASIEVDATGLVSIFGFTGAQNGTLPVRENGKLTWKTLEDIGAGDGNDNTTYQFAANAAGNGFIITPLFNGQPIMEGEEGEQTQVTYEVALAVYTKNEADAKFLTKSEAYDDSELVERVSDVEDALATETSERKAADEALTQAIADALETAKKYADEGDADTIYNDTEVRGLITGVSDRVTTLETTVGDETSGLVKGVADNAQAITDEATARTQGDTNTLTAAKAYTDEEIAGLDIIIEKKTVEDVESDYIVIKNKKGDEVASVNATKFVKDGMLDKAEYNKESKVLTLTWNTDAGKEATEIELNDLIDTYTGSEHIDVSTDGVISIKNTVALKTDITDLDTKLTAEIAKKRTEAEVDAQIDAKITTANLGQYAVKTDVETELNKKLDKSTYEADQAQYVTDKATFAVKTDVETELGKKVDKTTYESDKATFAIAETVEEQLSSVGERIDDIEDVVEANTKSIEDLEVSVTATYATKTELKATDDKTISNANAITNLTGRLDGIVAQGGEPNVINNISVNGVVQEIVDKVVDISVPVISDTKISQLNDGQALLDRVTVAEAGIVALETATSGNTTAISALATSVSTLETAVNTTIEGRLTSLEGTQATLVASVATNTADVADLKTEDARIAALVSANTAKFDNYYNKTEVDTAHAALEQAIANVDLDSRVAVTDFEKYKTDTADIIATLAVASDVESAIEAVSAEVAKKANADDVYTKTEADDKFLTESQVDARVNTLIGGAVSDDTITNVTNLVEFVNNNAGNIAQLVTDVKTNGEAITKNAKDITDINDAIAAIVQPKASTEISVDTNGTLGINEVNVNKLKQTAGDTLILNGGNASTTVVE